VKELYYNGTFTFPNMPPICCGVFSSLSFHLSKEPHSLQLSSLHIRRIRLETTGFDELLRAIPLLKRMSISLPATH
jgi:hypothetical protein